MTVWSSYSSSSSRLCQWSHPEHSKNRRQNNQDFVHRVKFFRRIIDRPWLAMTVEWWSVYIGMGDRMTAAADSKNIWLIGISSSGTLDLGVLLAPTVRSRQVWLTENHALNRVLDKQRPAELFSFPSSASCIPYTGNSLSAA